MKSSKTFNNISDKLKAQIPKLKQGETVVFRMLNGVPNPEPDEKERSKDPILYPKIQLLTQFRVFDKYQKDGSGDEVGGYVDVGCVDSWIGDSPAKIRTYVCGAGMYSRFKGKFELTGGNVRDEELYEIFWLSPQRKDSPCADSSVEVMFEILDAKADVKASVTKYDILKKALKYADELQSDVIRSRAIMAALNQPSYQDDEVLLAKIGELARITPDEFIKTFESKETPIIGIVKEAVDTKIIEYNLANGEVKMGGVKIAEIQVQSHDDFIIEFSRWINTALNGPDVLNNIKGRLEKKEVTK